jgi:O-glycosyl hydrolase
MMGQHLLLNRTITFPLGLILVGLLGISGTQAAPPLASIQVDTRQRFQEIDGFGVNFNGPYFRETQKPMVDLLVDDLGVTLVRLDAHGFDRSTWELVNDNDDPQVMNWDYYNDIYSVPNFEASWAASRYLNSKGVRVLLSAIGIVPEWMLDIKTSPPKHIASPPPLNQCKPDHLNPAMYEEFSEMLVSMAMNARTQAHVIFEYLSPFNETDCYPAEGPRIDPDEVSQVLKVLARRLQKEGLGDVRLVTAEQCNIGTDYISPILKDPELMKQVGVFAFHTYGEASVGPQVDRVQKSPFQNTRVWLTEYGDLNDRDKSFESEWNNQSMKATERALRALNQGAQAAFFWDAFDNLELCEMRPSFYGLMRNDNHHYSPKKRYYAARQLFRFVRPGSVRISATSTDPGLMVSAFRNDSAGSIVVVGIKRGDVAKQIQISLEDSPKIPGTWELYQTTRTLNCASSGILATVGNSVQVDLPNETIFTLVGHFQTR